MTYCVLTSLTFLCQQGNGLQPSIISLQPSVTTETRLASVYHTHIPRRTRRGSVMKQVYVSTLSRVYYSSLHSHNTL